MAISFKFHEGLWMNAYVITSESTNEDLSADLSRSGINTLNQNKCLTLIACKSTFPINGPIAPSWSG